MVFMLLLCVSTCVFVCAQHGFVCTYVWSTRSVPVHQYANMNQACVTVVSSWTLVRMFKIIWSGYLPNIPSIVLIRLTNCMTRTESHLHPQMGEPPTPSCCKDRLREPLSVHVAFSWIKWWLQQWTLESSWISKMWGEFSGNKISPLSWNSYKKLTFSGAVCRCGGDYSQHPQGCLGLVRSWLCGL